MSDDTETLVGCGCMVVAVTAWLLFMYVALLFIARLFG